LIGFRRTSRAGLVAGILVSLAYMAGATILTPDLWAEPLGALVKTGPAIVLMLFCLATLDDR
jgi:membrane-associated PAP2 superfamily phosphatase